MGSEIERMLRDSKTASDDDDGEVRGVRMLFHNEGPGDDFRTGKEIKLMIGGIDSR